VVSFFRSIVHLPNSLICQKYSFFNDLKSYYLLGDDRLRVNPKYNTPGSVFHLKTGQSARQFIN
jgi:hypothetical protein